MFDSRTRNASGGVQRQENNPPKGEEEHPPMGGGENTPLRRYKHLYNVKTFFARTIFIHSSNKFKHPPLVTNFCKIPWPDYEANSKSAVQTDCLNLYRVFRASIQVILICKHCTEHSGSCKMLWVTTNIYATSFILSTNTNWRHRPVCTSYYWHVR